MYKRQLTQGAQPPPGGFAFRWAAYTPAPGGAGGRLRADLDLADATHVTTTGDRSPSLGFRTGALRPGALYTFELTVTGGDVAAVGSVSALMNRPPFGGVLAVAPSAGEALSTVFELRADGWTDELEDLPLEYSFGYAAAAGESALGGAALSDADVAAAGDEPQALSAVPSRTPVIEAILPVGQHHVTVAVVDLFGARAEATASVAVSRAAALGAGAVARALERAANAVADGEASPANQLIVALAAEATARALGGDEGDVAAAGGGADGGQPLTERRRHRRLASDAPELGVELIGALLNLSLIHI